MAEDQPALEDYTTGAPRKHHRLYLQDGNFVIQVQSAIFRVHRSVLSGYSTVFQDMLNFPNQNESTDGTDEKPLILSGDNVAAWELLFKLQYDIPRVKSEPLTGEMLLLILSISHKYCMESLTNDILEELKNTSGYDGFVDIVVASQLIGSEQLYQEGIQRLVSSGRIPTKEQAKRMGAEATHAVMAAVINTLKETNAVEVEAARSEMHRKVTTVRVEMAKAVASVREEMLTSADNTRCRFCPRSTRWTCAYCYQPQNIPNN